jgi:hypothetical protein
MEAIRKLLGTPKNHEEEKAKAEVVEAPEFDITQYAKKLTVLVAAVAAAGAAALEVFDVKETEGMVIAAIGIVAVAVLGASLVMAVDLAARAYLTGSAAGKKREEEGAEEPTDEDPPETGLIAATPGTMVWLEGDDDPHPLLAISSDGEKVNSYLVASGSTVERPRGDHLMKAVDGSPKWHTPETIRAVKPAKWP